MSCDPNSFRKIDEIKEIDGSDKEILKSILADELNDAKGGKRRGKKLSKKYKNKNKKTRRKQKGGDMCDNLACISLLASILFIGYGISVCAYSQSYTTVLHFTFDGFQGALNILFGINAFTKYDAASKSGTVMEKQAAAHAGQWDIIGKMNGIYGYAGRITGYIRKLKTKGVSCRTVIPDPLFDFLKILCEVKNNKTSEAEAKIKITNLLQPIQDSENIINIEGNNIIIKNMKPEQVIKINIELLSSVVSPEPVNKIPDQEILHPVEEPLSEYQVPKSEGLRHRTISTVSPYKKGD
jgi:hypothetical protein